ncbi:MAG: U32 family peptidase [Tannerellaceae bacterium]|nr:U32 family peptidase [Tannerellaceae bacterium]
MKKIPRSIELLSPAKDLTCGIEAINHGADAVYIGAPKFGARAAAGNSLEDIARLCEYAHLFGVRIYVALNTILRESELEEAEKLVWDLYRIGVDALIIQDMGITRLSLPPIPLHASTQTDNRTPEKVKFLESAGFTQVVLARELSLNEIRAVAEQTKVALEVFVHGALCVSYSGQCYLSAALSGRSANRGECAQYCRLPYTMVDAGEKEIVSDKHLLSLKDMNRSDFLEELIDAGVSSFKIEGRLKDMAYVKNITAYYRQKLDRILAGRTDISRASHGNSHLTFTPVPEKSFNRGFTPFFLQERTQDITSFDTPKSIGEKLGKVRRVERNYFTVTGSNLALHNGDGLIYFNTKGQLEGFRVNKVEGEKIYPLEMPALRPDVVLYRNYDQEFEKQLDKPTAERKIPVTIEFLDNPFGYTLSMTDETGARVMITEQTDKEVARKEQTENIRTQLSKLGTTPFEVAEMRISLKENWFVPSSLLATMRRTATEKLVTDRMIRYRKELSEPVSNREVRNLPEKRLTYLGNVSNTQARLFYKERGVEEIEDAFEISPQKNVPLMFSKHCLRYSMGWCPVWQKEQSPYKEPFYLLYKDTRLKLQFDCKACRMLVWHDEKNKIS